MKQISDPRTPHRVPRFTQKQGQYLAFIHATTLVNGRPPAETDMQRFFGVTPPWVHEMVLTMERAGLVGRIPRTSRSVAILIDPTNVPPPRTRQEQLVKTPAQRY